MLTILVPRHIERGESLKKMAAVEGLSACLRTEMKSLKDVEVYIGDTLGEMGIFYALSPIVFMGATLVPKGGHNPIEAAQMGAYVLHGPHTYNNPQLYDILGGLGLSQDIEDEHDLAAFVAASLSDTKKRYEEPKVLKTFRDKGLQNLMQLLNPHLKCLQEERE